MMQTRICLIGPECTGKTTLAVRLAHELGATLIPEASRTYAETCGQALTRDDVEPIAHAAIATLDAANASLDAANASLDAASGNLQILDTDLLSTVVYARHYYGHCPRWIEEEARRRRADLYLLMDTDLPWESDPIRDRGGDAREDLFDAFRATLDEFETTWQIVSGTAEERWRRVLALARGRR